MTNSFQNEVPKARINIELILYIGGAWKAIESLLKLRVSGDFIPDHVCILRVLRKQELR